MALQGTNEQIIGTLTIHGASGSLATYEISNNIELIELLSRLINKNSDTISSITFNKNIKY